jgi:tetratricopeptide (TPR) repeat protein
MLASLASDGETPAALSASASGTLLRLLVEEGKMDEAERSLTQYRGVLSASEMATLTRRVALGWARAGKLDRAEVLAATDSSVEGLALRGQLSLFRGDIAGAVQLLRAAGPYAGTREQSTARTALLALLQPIEEDTLPELGAAFLALERGDTARAVAGFASLGAKRPRNKGGAELILLAGRLEASRGRAPAAERLFRAAVDSTAPAASPAALLELGRLLASSGRGGEAVPVFEQLILDYPRSPLVPQARRALDEAKGAVLQ